MGAKLAEKHRTPEQERRHEKYMRRRGAALAWQRSTLTEADVVAIWTAHRGRCAHCQGPATAINFIVPLSRGGECAAHNAVPSCSSCASTRGDKLIAEWSRAIKVQKPQPRTKPTPAMFDMEISVNGEVVKLMNCTVTKVRS